MKLKLGDGLNIPIEMAGQAVALVGIRGSGKTNTAGVIAEELLDHGQQIVVIDPTDAWWGLRSKYPVFIFGGPHGDLPLTETDGKTLAEFVVQEQVPIILSLRHLRKGAQRRLVTEFCEELYHLKGQPEYRTPLTVFIDEAPQFIPQRVMGEMARLVGAVQDMILLGRSVGFGVVMISQRFATLNADVRTQADTVIVHRLPSPLDRKALTDWIEENATIEEQKTVLSSLAKLKTGEAWIWAPYFDLFQQAQIRSRRTFDSSAAPKRGAPAARAPKDLAKVDIEKLKGKLSAAIDKAKADDPRELRKQLVDKNKEISRLVAEAARQANTKRAPICQPKTVEKPVLKDAQILALETAAARANKAIEKAAAMLGKPWRALGEQLAALTAAVQSVRQSALPIAPPMRAPQTPQDFGRMFEASAQVEPRRQPAAPRVPLKGGNNGHAASDRLPPGEHATLTAALQYEGLDRKRLSVLTGYKRSSRDAYIARLVAKGLIEVTGNALFATEAGHAALNGSFEPLPTGAELIEYWRQRLPEGERKSLEVLIERGGQDVERERIDAATGDRAGTPT